MTGIRSRLAAVAAALALVSTGCGGQSVARSAPSPSSNATSVTSKPAGWPVAVPITEPTDPEDLPGDDREFLRAVHALLKNHPASDVPDDTQIVEMGRKFCSIVSGGGQVAAKVDFWGGATPDWPAESDGHIFLAAMEVYCPASRAGYMEIRDHEEKDRREPSNAEKADLVRFEASLLVRAPAVKAKADDEIERAADVLCEVEFAPGWRARPDVRRTLDRLTLQTSMLFTLAVLANFCDSRSAEFHKWMTENPPN